jgi:hypothetical protein
MPSLLRSFAVFQTMSTELATASQELTRTLLATARAQCDLLIDAENAVREDLQKLCERLWELGETLAALKEEIGHGKWMFYVAANFPMLGGDERSRCNRANDAKAFFEANPNYPSSGNFSTDSIRRCVFHLAPEKERPELTGDTKLAPVVTFDTVSNKFALWNRRIREGHGTKPPVSVVKPQFQQIVSGLREMFGAEEVAEWLRVES